MKTKILIIEPSPIIVEGLKQLLGGLSRFSLLTPQPGVEHLEVSVTALKPDVVIVNPTLDEHVIDMLAAAGVKTAALVYQYVKQQLLHRADMVIDIRESQSSIVEHLMELASKDIDQGHRVRTDNYDLTKRETAVLVEVAKGLTNKEIADKLCVSVHTVISHRKNIIHKTGIKSVAGLTVYAMLNNLIDEA